MINEIIKLSYTLDLVDNSIREKILSLATDGVRNEIFRAMNFRAKSIFKFFQTENSDHFTTEIFGYFFGPKNSEVVSFSNVFNRFRQSTAFQWVRVSSRRLTSKLFYQRATIREPVSTIKVLFNPGLLRQNAYQRARAC